MRHIAPSRPPQAASRPGLAWALLLVLLGGLLWSWGTAQAADGPPADSELAHFLSPGVAGEHQSLEPSDRADSLTEAGCRRLATPPLAAWTDPLLSEISDHDLRARVAALWPALPQALPVAPVRTTWPQRAREPLLRPPAQQA